MALFSFSRTIEATLVATLPDAAAGRSSSKHQRYQIRCTQVSGIYNLQGHDGVLQEEKDDVSQKEEGETQAEVRPIQMEDNHRTCPRSQGGNQGTNEKATDLQQNLLHLCSRG